MICVRGKYRRAGILYGLLFGTFKILGRRILESGGQEVFEGTEIWGGGYGISFLTAFLGAGGMAALAFAFLGWMGGKYKTSGRKKLRFPVAYAGMLICYLPCFITYFPGCMSYDSWYITLEALGIIGFDNHHPFLHTFIWSIFAHMDEWLGVRQIGITLYTSGQLLIMVAVYAYVCVWISRRNLPGVMGKIAWIYYGLNPVFHIFSLILTKDVLFSGLFLLLCISLVDFLETVCGKRTEPSISIGLEIKTAVLLLLCCLFRNNMIYVAIVFICLLCLCFRVSVFRCKGLLAAVFLFFVITKVVYPGVGVAKGSVKEMLPVPLSQMAAVYHSDKTEAEENRKRINGNNEEDIGEAGTESGKIEIKKFEIKETRTGKIKEKELDAREKELLIKYIPSIEQYDRFFADPVKSDFNENAFRENPGEFIRLWGQLFLKYPDIYIEAFLALNLPYWYPEMESVREYIETDNYSQDYPVERKGWLPGVYRWYERVSENQAAWMHLPLFRQLYAIGVPIWVLLFFGLWFGIRKRKEALAVVTLSVLLWLTYLLGPVSSFRYVEPLLLTYPLWLALGIGGKQDGGNEFSNMPRIILRQRGAVAFRFTKMYEASVGRMQ